VVAEHSKVPNPSFDSTSFPGLFPRGNEVAFYSLKGMTSTSVPVPTGSAHPVLRYQLVEKDWKIFPTLFNFLLCNLHAALQDLSIFFSRQCNKNFAGNSNLYSDQTVTSLY